MVSFLRLNQKQRQVYDAVNLNCHRGSLASFHKKGESLANIRAHPWNGWTVTSSEVPVLWTVKSSIPATSAAVSFAPDGCLRMSGTVTSPNFFLWDTYLKSKACNVFLVSWITEL